MFVRWRHSGSVHLTIIQLVDDNTNYHFCCSHWLGLNSWTTDTDQLLIYQFGWGQQNWCSDSRYDEGSWTRPAGGIETWTKIDDPNTIKYNLAPPGFRILYIHWPIIAGRPTRSWWLSADAVAVKQTQHLEYRWKSTGDETDRVLYRNADKGTNNFINAFRNKNRCDLVTTAAGNSRCVWTECKNLLHTSPPTDLGTNEECQLFTKVLATYFINKVHNIKIAIGAALHGMASDSLMLDMPHLGAQLCDLDSVTMAKVEHLLWSMSGMSSPMDFVPISLMKTCSDVFSPIIARPANLSFQQGVVPTKFKAASVALLIKRHELHNNAPQISDWCQTTTQSVKLSNICSSPD